MISRSIAWQAPKYTEQSSGILAGT